MQHVINSLNNWSDAQRQKRQSEQMTLGTLIDLLKAQPYGKQIQNIVSPHSCRAFCRDLSFRLKQDTRSVKSLMKMLETKCLNKRLRNYDGGDYLMDKDTPIWIGQPNSKMPKVILGVADGDVLTFIVKPTI